MADKGYANGSFFEILVNRALRTSDKKRPDLENLIHAEEGLSFSRLGTTAQQLEKTKALLTKSLKALIASRIINRECRAKLEDLLISSDNVTNADSIYAIATEALELTNKYKEKFFKISK